MIPLTHHGETGVPLCRRVAVAALAAALAFAAGSCGISSLAPTNDTTAAGAGGAGLARPAGAGTAAPQGGVGLDPGAQVPAIVKLQGKVEHGTLHVTGDLVARGGRPRPEYSPYEPGGWCLQVFLDTDQRGTGYWYGYEYIVRGVEWDPEGRTVVVRRIAPGPGYPGGWGPASGEAVLRLHRTGFSIAVPLDAIGGDDGDLDFAVETYATVTGPFGSGYTHWYVADYFGTCSAHGRAVPDPASPAAAERPEHLLPRPHAGSAAPGR